MISVILDEEMVELFKNKVYRDDISLFVPGTMLYLDGFCVYGERGNCVFHTMQYDDEFTEWLKVHRPEIFL